MKLPQDMLDQYGVIKQELIMGRVAPETIRMMLYKMILGLPPGDLKTGAFYELATCSDQTARDMLIKNITDLGA